MIYPLCFADAGLELRFWAKVCKSDGCWTWTASCTKAGYGQIRRKGGVFYAHRLVYELAHGPIPPGLFVLHSCDNRRCVNPDHLSIGTAQDNTQDMMVKSRGRFPGPIESAKGERHGMAKLTWQKVSEIRRRFQVGGITQVELGDEYGVSGAHVCGIISGKLWKEALPPLR